MNEPPPEKITAQIWLAVDSRGNWIARGEGYRDEPSRRDEHLPLGGEHLDGLGDDDRAVEWMSVLVEVPLPKMKVLAGRLFA